RLVAGVAVGARHGLDQLPARHFLVERVGFRAVTDPLLGIFAPPIPAANGYAAQIRTQLARCEPHQRALSRALGAGTSRYSGPQLQCYLIHADDRAVPLRDALEQEKGASLVACPLSFVLCSGVLLRHK